VFLKGTVPRSYLTCAARSGVIGEAQTLLYSYVSQIAVPGNGKSEAK